MTDTNTPHSQQSPVFDVSASVRVDAAPHEVYALASDITRMGEWSPENTGGTWNSGEPGTVGARFHGHNSTPTREWTTECEVVEATPGRRFAWVVHSSVDAADTSLWSFDVEPDGTTTLLTQRYVMSHLRHGMRSLMDGMSEAESEAFVEQRRTQLQDGLNRTVEGIRKAAEQR